MLQKIIKVGNSSTITLPHKILKEEGLLPDDMIRCPRHKKSIQSHLRAPQKAFMQKGSYYP